MNASSGGVAPLAAPTAANQTAFHRILYGLPCARCGSYYAAELEACPICHCSERVSPVAQAKLR